MPSLLNTGALPQERVQYQLDAFYFRLKIEIEIAMVNMAMVQYFLPNLRKKLQDNNLPGLSCTA
jgi:hypothetical protein